MLTNGGIKAVKTFLCLSVTAGEIILLHHEESVSTASFTGVCVVVQTDRHTQT